MASGAVTIVASADPVDQRVVREIHKALGRHVQIFDVDIDDLAARSTHMRRSRHFITNVSVFVISEATLASKTRRAVLVDGNPFVEDGTVRTYFIWRMRDPAKTIAQYSDLTLLADVLPPPRPRHEVIADLDAYVRAHPNAGILERLRQFPALLGGLLLMRLFYVFICLRLVGQVALWGSPLLGLLLLFDAGANWRAVLALAALLDVGYVIAGIETLDIWPWRGGDVRADAAEHALRTVRVQTILTQSAVLSLLVVPAAAAVHIDRVPLTWVAATIAIGTAYEIILTNFYRYAWPRHYARRGIGATSIVDQRVVMMRVRLKGRRLRRPTRVPFTVAEQRWIQRWMSDLQLGARAFARPWFRQKDFVFISYAWADDKQKRRVLALSDALTRAHIPHFLDRHAISSDYDAWRPPVAAGLARATHVLLVVSRCLGDGKTVRREAAMITTRWHIDTLPAVLCVGDRALGIELASRSRVPLELRFMLAWCTWLTDEEALDPVRLGESIAAHRRQGRLRDWWTLFAGLPSSERHSSRKSPS